MILPGACVITFGKMVRDRKKAQQAENGELAEATTLRTRRSFTAWMYGREGRSIFAAMGIIFLIGLGVCFWSEARATRPCRRLA